MYTDNAEKLAKGIKDVDEFTQSLLEVFKNISTKHKSDGDHIEYAYLEHFLEESLDISRLFLHLFSNKDTQRFLSIGNRMMFETMLKIEYIIRLKKEGDDNVILSLMSKDMASSMSALDEAVGSSEGNPAKDTLLKMGIVNKLLKTDFDLNKVKPTRRPFPDVKKLCEGSNICLKDYCREKLYHYYAMWSRDNHSRLGSKFTMEDSSSYVINNQVEIFIEMYLKTLKLLSIHAEAEEVRKKVSAVMSEIGVKFV